MKFSIAFHLELYYYQSSVSSPNMTICMKYFALTVCWILNSPVNIKKMCLSSFK